MDSRVPIKTDKGMIWVDGETASMIAKGELNPNAPASPEWKRDVLNSALAEMHWPDT